MRKGSRKDGKFGKDAGGVVAAVTKHGAKFSSNDGPRAILPTAWPNLAPSSEAKWVIPNDVMAPSPLLDALSTASFATSNSPHTREWTKGIGEGMAGSPGNLISLSGESPPTAPSSYEDTRGLASGWSSPKAAPNHYYSVSPPAAASNGQPLSFQMDAFPQADMLQQQNVAAAAAATRRSSLHSHFAPARAQMTNTRLPHQAQPHLYGAADMDLEPNLQKELKAGEGDFYFGFDTIPASGEMALGKDNVVLAGFEGGLDICSLTKRGLEAAMRLKGLRGCVCHAKILPWTDSRCEQYPLVALVLHGPSLPLPTPGGSVEREHETVSTDRSEAMAKVRPDAGPRPTRMSAGFVEFYQTTVEVYSLRTNKHVRTLLEAPKMPLKTPITSPLFKAPPPSGALSIMAERDHIVVTSGLTGECWIYRQVRAPPELGPQFCAMGKVWTSVQQPLRGEVGQEAEHVRLSNAPTTQRAPRWSSAIVGIKGRWLAYCPAAPSSQLGLRASIPVTAQARSPGLASMTAPHLPCANTELELPLSESVMNKIVRDVSQEVIQGARWVSKQAGQAWSKYWNPQPVQRPSAPCLIPGAQPWPGAEIPFPPTHGTVTAPVHKDPGLVSILDLDSLPLSPNIHPIATFAVPHGCSFLKFSPAGLSLFTASTKGDVQTVWDLMRIQYTKASPLQPTGLMQSGGPRVRQVAQFSRLTVARIVDVTWTRPNGERIAMVTENRTVHLLDLPAGAFTWPPPRRRPKPQEATAPLQEGSNAPASFASTALSSARDIARPFIHRPGRRITNGRPKTGAGLGDYAAHGGKAIVSGFSGISQTLGKTVSSHRHNGENRAPLPSALTPPGPSCVFWMTGRRDHVLFVLGNGIVRNFTAKNRKTTAGFGKRMARLSGYSDFSYPRLPDERIAPAVRRYLEPDEYPDVDERDMGHGNNSVLLEPKARQVLHRTSAGSAIPQAEIESSVPYQPFHTDKRVELYDYDEARDMSVPFNATASAEALTDTPTRRKHPDGCRRQQAAAGHQQLAFTPSKAHGYWVFGQSIKAIRLDVSLDGVSAEESAQGTDDSRALPASAIERVLHRAGDDEQIVVTTRRRRGAGLACKADDDGFWEDDCEVLDFADQRV